MTDRLRRLAWGVLAAGWLVPAFVGGEIRRRAAALPAPHADALLHAGQLMHWLTAGWLMVLVAYAMVHASRVRKGLK
jgi:hypothetical protein